MLRRSLYTAVLGALLVVGGMSANAVTLAQLAAGSAGILGPGTPAGTLLTNGEVKVGPLVFSNFVITSLYPDPGPPPSPLSPWNPADVFVGAQSAGGMFGLTYNSPSDWIRTDAGPVVDPTDLSFNYDISINPLAPGTQITDAYMSASLVGQLTGSGLVNNDVAKAVVSDFLSNGYSLLVGNGQEVVGGVVTNMPFASPPAYVTFAPVSSLTAFKDIGMDIQLAGTETGTIHMSGMVQLYSTTPEPGTLAMLFGFGVASTMFGLRRRIRR